MNNRRIKIGEAARTVLSPASVGDDAVLHAANAPWVARPRAKRSRDLLLTESFRTSAFVAMRVAVANEHRDGLSAWFVTRLHAVTLMWTHERLIIADPKER